jgi:hypothetical protein
MRSERIHTFPDTVRIRSPEVGEDGETQEQEEEAENPTAALISGLRSLRSLGWGRVERCGSHEDTGTLIHPSSHTLKSSARFGTQCWIPSTASIAWPGTHPGP